jgi:hypothetical protein
MPIIGGSFEMSKEIEEQLLERIAELICEKSKITCEANPNIEPMTTEEAKELFLEVIADKPLES